MPTADPLATSPSPQAEAAASTTDAAVGSGPPLGAPGVRPTGGDPSRTGALWLGAAGVAMLLAAASVLTAVRWDDIGQTAKLGGFTAITLALLLGGQRLRTVIPLTGRAIFHLGALLVPLDMAAVAVLAERSWQQTLLLTASAAVGSWYALQRVDRSPVLRWAARGSMVVLAAGVAAVAPVSMPLVLAAIAAGGFIAGVLIEGSLRRVWDSAAVTAWAGIAGLLPLAAQVQWPMQLAGGAGDLGFAAGDRWQLLLAGVIAIVVTAGLTVRRPSLWRAWSTIVLAVVTSATAAVAFTTAGTGPIVAAGLFVAGQALSWSTSNDEDWRPITAQIAPIGEVAAAFGTVLTVTDAVIGRSPGLGVASLLLGLGWLSADRRRVLEPSDWLVGALYGSGWWPTTMLAPLAALGAVVGFGGGSVAVALTLVAAAAWMLATGRQYGAWVAVPNLLGAAVLGLLAATSGTALGVAVLAAVVAAVGARIERDELTRMALGAVAAGCLTVAISPLDSVVGASWLPLIAAGYWALAALAETRRLDVAGVPGRGAAVITTLAVWGVSPTIGLVTCAVVAVLASVDAWRCEVPAYGWLAAAVGAVALVPVGTLAGFSVAGTGVLATAVATVAVGLMVAAPQRFEGSLAFFAATATVLGVVQAATVADLFGPALVFVGTSIVLFGAATRALALTGLGGFVMTSGVWSQLAVWEVTWLEAYLAIPAVLALWAGSYWHRSGSSSWVAYAPTIAVFGCVALADRLTGGSAWHAVIAGGVAVAAIVAGAVFRLVGPLLVGSALLATVTVYESLGPGSRVPTWAWLALGGAVLLGSAVALERSVTGPLERGQRIIASLSTHFT